MANWKVAKTFGGDVKLNKVDGNKSSTYNVSIMGNEIRVIGQKGLLKLPENVKIMVLDKVKEIHGEREWNLLNG